MRRSGIGAVVVCTIFTTATIPVAVNAQQTGEPSQQSEAGDDPTFRTGEAPKQYPTDQQAGTPAKEEARLGADAELLAALEDPAAELEQVRALSEVESVLLMNVNELEPEGDKTAPARQLIEDSDRTAIRDFLKEDSAAAREIKDAISAEGVGEDQVVAVAVRDPNVITVFYREER